jgi:TPR repeat protein
MQSNLNKAVCSILNEPIKKNDLDFYQLLKKLTLKNDKNNVKFESLKSIGEILLNKSIEHLTLNGFNNMKPIIESLSHSSCLHNHRASIILSVIYSHGIGVDSINNEKSIYYLMRGALTNDRLSLLTLGFKHQQGIDLPKDYDQSFCKKLNLFIILNNQL